jgi:hypothetical protein
MANLKLTGPLNLQGMLTLKGGAGGKVTVGSDEVLVEVTPGSSSQGTAPPVIMPPPPGTPVTLKPDVWIVTSFNKTVKAGAAYIVAQGMAMQGESAAPWPGMVLPSSVNSTVTINHIPINVVNDMGVIFPSGGSAKFNSSGQ